MRFLRCAVGIGVLAGLALSSAGASGAVIKVDRVVKGGLQYNRIALTTQGIPPSTRVMDVLSTTGASQKSVVAQGGDTVQFTFMLDQPTWFEFSKASSSIGARFRMLSSNPPKPPSVGTLVDAPPVEWVDTRWLFDPVGSATLYTDWNQEGGGVAEYESTHLMPILDSAVDPWLLPPGIARGFRGSFTLPGDFPQTQFSDFAWMVSASLDGPDAPGMLVRTAVPEPAGAGVIVIAGGLALRRRR